MGALPLGAGRGSYSTFYLREEGDGAADECSILHPELEGDPPSPSQLDPAPAGPKHAPAAAAAGTTTPAALGESAAPGLPHQDSEVMLDRPPGGAMIF